MADLQQAKRNGRVLLIARKQSVIKQKNAGVRGPLRGPAVKIAGPNIFKRPGAVGRQRAVSDESCLQIVGLQPHIGKVLRLHQKFVRGCPLFRAADELRVSGHQLQWIVGYGELLKWSDQRTRRNDGTKSGRRRRGLGERNARQHSSR